MANIAPYWLATGTAPRFKTGTRTRLAAPVTQTPSTAVPLAQMFKYVMIKPSHLVWKVLPLLEICRTSTKTCPRTTDNPPSRFHPEKSVHDLTIFPFTGTLPSRGE